MQQLPLFLNSNGLSALIAGSTSASLSKAVILLERGVTVTLVGRGMADTVAASGLISQFTDQITVLDRRFSEDDLAGHELVYIAEDNSAEEERILTWARMQRKRINVVDKPHLSDFSTPAAVSRGPISIAISSGGAAPVFVRRIRAALEAVLPKVLGSLASVSGQIRPTLAGLFTTIKQRRDFWDNVYDRADDFYGLRDGEIATQLLAKAKQQADVEAGLSKSETGLVQLVGAGPGDAELLTIKAHRALQRADVIYYDQLVSQEVLSLARRDAEFFFVGKREGNHGVGQNAINDLLVREAQKGRRVVRLKGGDPLTFARAGEELAALRDHSIPLQVIPGITALTGIAASLAMPLTDRNHAAAVTLVTGTLQDGSGQNFKDNAQALAGKGKTMAVYMGLKKAGAIQQQLIDGGVNPATPVAIIENGTRDSERRFFTPLSDLHNTVVRETVQSPALLIIGDVVSAAHIAQVAPQPLALSA